MRFFSTLIALLWSSVKGQEPKANPSGQINSVSPSSSTENYSSSTDLCSFSSSSSSTEICSFPTSCFAAASTSAFPPEIESKFYAMNPLESCNIEHFCIKNPPGSYCYTPVREILGRRKCKCLKTAFIECPFGVVNACKRGFVCGQGVNSIGITTAFCSRMATATYNQTQMVTTSMVPTSFLSSTSSSTLVIISSTVYNTQPSMGEGAATPPKVITTSIPFTTSVQFTISTAYPLITRISTLLTSSVPVTLEPKAMPTFTVSDCASGGISSFSVPSVFPETGLATQLCRGPYPGRVAQREPYVIRCIESATTTSAKKSESSMSATGSSSAKTSISAIGKTLTSKTSTAMGSISSTSMTSTAMTSNQSTMNTTASSTISSTSSINTTQSINTTHSAINTFPTSTIAIVTTINGQITTIFQAGETIAPPPPPITTFYPFEP